MVFVEEEMMHAVTALSGSGPAYVYMVIEAMIAGGLKVGLSRQPSKPKPKNENPVRILCIGDIFGSPGRRIVADHLQDIVKAQGSDLAIANAENSAGGFGITPGIAEDLFAL